MRDRANDCLRLDELIEELQEIREQHGDLFTNVRAPDLWIGERYGPKELRINCK